MKKNRKPVMALFAFIFAFSLLLAACMNHAKASDASGPLRVMTFNLRTANATDAQPWEKRRPVMKQLIQTEKPDVIGTQEGTFNQITDLEADLPGYSWIGVGREGGNLGEHMAIYYNKERLKPLEQDHYWLSDSPNVIGTVSWGNKIPRMVTWVRFQEIHTGKTFYMVNTHLDHASEASRQKSAQLIVDRLKAFDPEVPVILTADFNTPAGGAVYKIFTEQGAMQDAFASAHQRVNDSIGTFHNYSDPAGGGSSRRIDWILDRGKINVVRSETVTFNTYGQYPSDHYPVMVDLVLQKTSKSTAEETVAKQPTSTALLITEIVPNSNDKGNYNYVEIYNSSNKAIDLEGYKIYYYYDPEAPFDKAKANKWTITKDQSGSGTVIQPNETKVIWIKKQPCCYNFDIEQFRANYGLSEAEFGPEQLLAVFTPGTNQGFNGAATNGRAISITSPDGYHLIGAQFNKGMLDVKANESVIYTDPLHLTSIMQKLAGNQKPTPGKSNTGQRNGTEN